MSRIEARKDGDKEDKKKAETVLISTISSSFWGQKDDGAQDTAADVRL